MKALAIAWLLIGLSGLVLAIQDIRNAGAELIRHIEYGLIAAAYISLSFGCVALAVGFYRNSPFSRKLGQAIAIVLGAHFLLYFAANALFFSRHQHTSHFLGLLLAIAGLVFCWLTVRAARGISPNNSFKADAPGGARP